MFQFFYDKIFYSCSINFRLEFQSGFLLAAVMHGFLLVSKIMSVEANILLAESDCNLIAFLQSSTHLNHVNHQKN